MDGMEIKLKPIVDAIKNKRKVSFFVGAGVSTGAGIPDFRSPETGLYSNLAKLNLPYAEAVFDIDYFKEKPHAFYTLADELYPGKFKPTKFHYLMRLFQDKSLLHRIYTQNIDTLERVAGIKEEFIIEAHGSFAKNHCIDCNEEMASELLKELMQKKENGGIPTCESCGGYVKPDIVFFGEALPSKFFQMWQKDADEIEIAMVAGTSLTVYPFAGLPSEVKRSAFRVLVNNVVVGDFKDSKRKKDILAILDCDAYADLLAKLLGWQEELETLIEAYEVGSEKAIGEVDSEEGKSKKEEGTKLAHQIAKEIEERTENDEDIESKNASRKIDELDEEIANLKI